MTGEVQVVRVQNGPWWKWVLERYGFPTLAAIGLAVGFVYFYNDVKTERVAAVEQAKQDKDEYLEVLSGIKDTQRDFVTEQRKTNENLETLIEKH